MDLLGNYYTSSDHEESSSCSESSRSPPTPIVQKALLHMGALPPSIRTAQKPAPVKGGTQASRSNRRGKKLISLHSVLPPQILEQLANSESARSFEDRSVDEDENNSPRREPTTKVTPKAQALKDEGIANFLSALESAKRNGKVKDDVPCANSDSMGKLGASLVSVASASTTREKKDGTLTTALADARQTPTQQGEGSAGSPSRYTPLSLSPGTAFHPFRTSGVGAVPPVPISTAMPAVATMPPHFLAPPPSMQSYENTVSSQPGKSRFQKRQLQKALRAGNLDQALAGGGSNVTNLEQAEPTAYVPQPETYAVPTNGVRVAATQMYNPKAGTDVQVNLGAVRVKGKNQINHLMASAANFELQQARLGQKSSNQRAGAKRKYGW